MKKTSDRNPLVGKVLYVPRMCTQTTEIFCAALRSLGVDARPTPDSDVRTRELAASYCTGDECYPQIVTLGDLLKVTEDPGFVPAETAVFLPSTGGPCRFGQYSQLLRKVLAAKGLEEVLIVSPTCENGYRDLGKNGPEMMHYAWWAIVVGDLIRKATLRTRPYERHRGETDAVGAACVADVADVIARTDRRGREKFTDVKDALRRCRRRFAAIDANYTSDRLLIGVGGEIFCRINTYANDDIARKIEAHGGEAWVADMSEWIYYANYWEMESLRTFENPASIRVLGSWLSDRLQRRNEHELTAILADMLAGWEEPASVRQIVERGGRYINPHAAMGEMILNLGKASWLHEKGADGMIDISPFSCMNGIICESLYPVVSADLDGFPIRNLYFDGTRSDTDEDVAIFMELAAHYSRKKKTDRRVPDFFDRPGGSEQVA